MAAVWTASADYTAVVTAARNALAVGGSLSGLNLLKVIDLLEAAANTLDDNAEAATVNTDADALEASLVTHIANWVAVGVGDSSAVRTTAVAAWAPLRTALIASANAVVASGGSTITDITSSDALDGRSA